jgi:thiamine transport system substrate-binding protein
MQVEVAAKLAGSDQPELADKFLQFMVSDAFQSVIPTTNWMYPAVTPAEGLPAGFEDLIEPHKSLLVPSAEVPALRDAALSEWLDALSQ